ncbi:MAG: hypothetical protein AAF675_10080 [Pseudomonadota bacterium]
MTIAGCIVAMAALGYWTWLAARPTEDRIPVRIRVEDEHQHVRRDDDRY